MIAGAHALALLLLLTGPSEPAEEAPTPAPGVRAGIVLRHISALDDVERTFEAEFDLWLRHAGAMDPQDLSFPDAATTVVLGPPIESVDRGSEHYRLFRVRTTLRFRVDKDDLLRERRQLHIRVGPCSPGLADRSFALDYSGMGLPSAGGSASIDPLDAEDVLAGLPGWSLVAAEFSAATMTRPTRGDPRSVGTVQECPVIDASVSVRRSPASPRSLLSAVHPPPAPGWGGLLALGLFVLAYVVLPRRLPQRARIVTRLLAGTLACYCAEPLLADLARTHLSLEGLDLLLTALRCAWWLVPVIWLQALLPPFVWQPLGRRSGHPISALTQTLIPLVGYIFTGALILRFVFDQPLTTVWTASGVLTVVLGISLQSLILDAFAGVMLNLERPFKILHWINVGGQYEGQVIEMNWRATRLLTRANNIVSVPNSQITRGAITNYVLPTSVSGLDVTLFLDESVPAKQARALLREGVLRAAEQGRVLAEPQPRVIMESSREHGVRYKVMFFANLSLVSAVAACADVIEAVVERLAEEGIQVTSLAPVMMMKNGHGSVMHPGRPGSAGLPGADGPPLNDRPPPISTEQIALVQQSWAKVVPIAEAAATLFYQRLFELDPTLKPLFRTEAKTQRGKLIGMLTLVVKGLRHLDGLVATLQDLGLRHVTYGVQDSHYDTVGEALLWALEKGLGDQFTVEVRAAWVRAYSLVATTMKAAK